MNYNTIKYIDDQDIHVDNIINILKNHSIIKNKTDIKQIYIVGSTYYTEKIEKDLDVVVLLKEPLKTQKEIMEDGYDMFISNQNFINELIQVKSKDIIQTRCFVNFEKKVIFGELETIKDFLPIENDFKTKTKEVVFNLLETSRYVLDYNSIPRGMFYLILALKKFEAQDTKMKKEYLEIIKEIKNWEKGKTFDK